MLINGVHLLPDLSGALLWPKQRLLVIADPQFEKGRGGTLEKLARLLRQVQPRTVVCLGGSAGRLSDADAEALRRLVGSCEWLWIGDGALAGFGGTVLPELVRGDLAFRHEPRLDAAPGEIAGRLLPRAAVVTRAGRMVRPCFVMDGRRAILPAFGGPAGALDVLDPALRPLFKRGFHVILLGPDKLHSLPRGRLDAGERAASPEMPAERRPTSPSGTKLKLL